MEKLNAKDMIGQARESLAGKQAVRLAALHTGIAVGAGLLITVIQYILSRGIGNTGGLSGLGTRSILETVQLVLQWANTILTPFWSLGFVYAAMLWSKDRQAGFGDLTMGFRRVGPCLGLMLNRAVLTFSTMMICANVASAVFMVTPAADALTGLLGEAGTDMDAAYALMEQMSQQQLAQILRSMVPVLVIWGVLCLVILVPLLYRFRMAEYAILENKGLRALSAMVVSASLLRRRCWQLVKLDLRFWWYYGLKFLCGILLYADMLLELLGVPLPLGEDGLFFGTYILYLAAFFAVEALCRPRVATAYACAYTRLTELGPIVKKAPKVPQKMPWDET